MTTKEAISEVVSYETLPPQIDYRQSYVNRARVAKAFLQTLPIKEMDKAYAEIEKQVSAYYEPVEMLDGSYSSPAEMDAMF